MATFVMSKADAYSHIISHIMYNIILVNAQRSVFDRFSELPNVFTCRACYGDPVNGVKAFTFDTLQRAEEAAKEYARIRPDHKYMPLSPTLDIIEHARVNEGTTFVQVDFDSNL